MRITGLKVDGFGVWSGLELPELSDQLNVFYGPNEAGKTTLMQFVRSMLYGFAAERRGRYLPPVHPAGPAVLCRPWPVNRATRSAATPTSRAKWVRRPWSATAGRRCTTSTL